MSKKLFCLISFVLVLSLVTNALAVTLVWDNNSGTGDQKWETPSNWDIDAVPTIDDWAIISDTFVDDANGPIIDTDTNAVCRWLDFGYDTVSDGDGPWPLPLDGDAVLTMTGGKLTARSYITMIDAGADGNAVFNMSGGVVKTLGAGGWINSFNVGKEGAGIATFNISGDSTVDVTGIFRIGWWGSLGPPGVKGIVNMSGGTINTDGIIVGQWDFAEGDINITAGDVNISGFLNIGGWTDLMTGNGHIDLHGGTITASFLTIGGGGEGTIDITDGVLIIDGDLRGANGWLFDPLNDTANGGGSYTGTLAILIERGLITAFDVNSGELVTGGRAIVNVDFDVTNPGKTTLSASLVDPNLAWGPNPGNGTTRHLPTDITEISWKPGENAASHDVYFGTDFTEVSDATTSSGVYKGTQALSEVNYPVSITWGKTYYWRIDEVNAATATTWKGTVWNFVTIPAWATNPSPGDGEGEVSATAAVVLSWDSGPEANEHQVYFSTDFNDVNDRDPCVMTVVSDPCYIPGTLEELNTWYYWAVDEVNLAADVNVWPGNVWDFLTDEHLTVDDMDLYVDNAALEAVWTPTNGADLFIEKRPDYVRDGNSMMFTYDNPKTGGQGFLGSEAAADASALEAGTRWTIGGAKALVLYFLGDPANGQDPATGYTITNDQMYVALEDGGPNVSVVEYDGDMNDVTEAFWHEWDIDLTDPCLAGVNMANVAKVYIGFGGQKTGQSGPGAGSKSGQRDTVWFDDIEVWPPWCRSEFVPTDFTGDCKTDIDDLEIMSADWLVYDFNFIAALPSEANLIGWWKFDEGSGANTVDSSIYDNNGIVFDASWVDGHVGPNSLHFHGDGIVDFDRVVCAERDACEPGIYPAELMPDTFTIACWVKLSSFPSFGTFVSNGADWGSHEDGFYLYNFGWIDESGKDFGLGIRTEDGMFYVETPSIYEPGIWYHLAATYDDANKASVYVDGLLAAGPTDVGGPIRWVSSWNDSYPEYFLIGVFQYGPDMVDWYFADSAIDDVRYYDYALSQGEILVLADPATLGETFYQPVPSRANLVDPEAQYSRKVNFLDYRILADHWLEEPPLWPSP